jgi:ketosteroid isomerase-like protein
MKSHPMTSSAAARRSAHPRSIAVLGLSLLLAGVSALGLIALCACGGTSTTASSSPSAATTAPSASPSMVPAEEPVSQWDAPGTASMAQTQAVTRRYAAALHAEKIPNARLYAHGATWDIWSSEEHRQGGPAIAKVYRDVAGDCDWSKGHVLAARGVGVDEGVFTMYGTVSTPSVSLLAVDGDRIVHEEIFLNEGTGRPVTFYRAAPGPKDTAKVAAKVAAAVGEAFASGDQAALQELLAPDILFYDTELTHGVRGLDAVLAWQSNTPTVELTNHEPLAGPGWAAVRWTVRQVFPTGVELAMPGMTVMEVRDGKVVRMTLYYDSSVMRLQT